MTQELPESLRKLSENLSTFADSERRLIDLGIIEAWRVLQEELPSVEKMRALRTEQDIEEYMQEVKGWHAPDKCPQRIFVGNFTTTPIPIGWLSPEQVAQKVENTQKVLSNLDCFCNQYTPGELCKECQARQAFDKNFGGEQK